MLPVLISETFKGLGIAAIIFFLLKLFADNFIKSLFQRDLESHKANLRLEGERELAQMRAANETLLTEYKEKISHLSRERIEAIKGASQKLIAVWAALEEITAFMKSPLSEHESNEERSKREFQALVNSANDFLEYLKTVEIFFPDVLSEKMLKFRISINAVWMGWGGVMSRYMSEEKRLECYNNLRERRDALEPDFKNIRAALRVLLGVG